MEMREEGFGSHNCETKSKYAKKNVANTALGLSIGALGLMLLGGNGLNGLTGNAGNNTCGGPTAWETWQKECSDTLMQLEQRFNDRLVIDTLMFGLYKSQIDADFNLYKSSRDNFDILNNKVSNLETQVAVTNAIRPYQDKLIMCEIADSRKDARYNLDRRTCRMISGELVLPNTPTITGFGSFDPPCSCN